MVQHLQIRPSFRTTFQRQSRFTRVVAYGFAILLFATTVLTLIDAAHFASAAAPAYRQTSQIGTPQPLLAPYYFATDDANNFYVADGDNYVIRKFSPSGDLLLTFGPGDWIENEFGWMAGIDVKSNGEIYVSDGDHYRINVYSATGIFLRTFGTEGSTNPGEFSSNGRIRFAPNGNLYVADGDRIHIFDANDNPISKVGTSGSAPGELDYVEGIAFDTNGDVYIADYYNKRVSVFDTNWNYLRSMGQAGAYPAANGGDLYYPGGIDLTSDGYVLVGSANTVKWFDKNTGVYVKRIGLADGSSSYASGVPSGVEDVVVSANGKIHTIEPNMSRIQTFSSTGVYESQFGDFGSDPGQFFGPLGVDVDEFDNIYVVDSVNERVQKFDKDGDFLLQFGTSGTANGQFRRPRDIAISPLNDRVYVTEWSSGPQTARVQIFDQSGNYISQFGSQGQGNGQFSSSTTIAISPINGDVYVNDQSHNGGGRVEIFDANGVFLRNWNPITPIDMYSSAAGLTFDAIGNIYVTAGQTGHIFKFNQSEQLIATLGQRAINDVGDSMSGYGEIEVADNGTIYVANTPAHRIDILDSQGIKIGKIGTRGNGPNQFEWPQDLVLDSANRLIVADDDNSRIPIYTLDGSISPASSPRNIIANKVNNKINLDWDAPSTAGNGTIMEYRVEYSMLDTHNQWETYATVPASETSITMENLPADRYQVRVTAWNEAGAGTSGLVTGTISLASPLKYEDTYSLPPGTGSAAGIGVYADGSFTIPSRNLSTRFQYDVNGVFTNMLGSFGTGTTQARYYGGADTDASDNLYVADRDNVRINKYAKDGTLIGVYSSGFNPNGISVDRTNGYYYVAANSSVRKYTLAGVFVSSFAPAVTQPRAVDVAPDGSIYIAHQTGGIAEVAKYNAAGTKLSAFPIAADATWSIAGIAVLTSGEVVVSDASNSTVSIYASDGTLKGTLGYSTIVDTLDAGDYFGRFNSPENITVVNDLVYIPDGRNGRVQVYSLAPASTQTVSSPPQAVTGDTNTANQAIVNWAAPADDGGSTINDYSVDYKLSTDSTWTTVSVTPPSTSHTLTNLPAGQYDVRLSATNGTGTSDLTTPISLTVIGPGTPLTAPSSPQAVSILNTTPNALTINWQTPANNGGSTVTDYLLEYKKQSDSAWTQQNIVAPTTSYTITGLSAGDYEIRLSAINAIGTSAPTATTVSTVTNPPVTANTPNPPSSQDSSNASVSSQPSGNLGANNTPNEETTATPTDTQSIEIIEQSEEGQVIIAWQPPSEGDPESYIIEYDDTSDNIENWQVSTTVNAGRHRVSITLPAGDYNIRVSALMRGETPTRVILGIAKVSVTSPVMYGDGPSTVAAIDPSPADNTVRNWIAGCAASVMVASLFIIPLLWKRRRKKNQKNTVQLPPQRWQ